MSDKQAEAFARLIKQYQPNMLRIEYAPFDLPEGYVAFSLETRTHSHVIHGGIDLEGNVST